MKLQTVLTQGHPVSSTKSLTGILLAGLLLVFSAFPLEAQAACGKFGACQEDRTRFCPELDWLGCEHPGLGRCLWSHEAELTEGCKALIKKHRQGGPRHPGPWRPGMQPGQGRRQGMPEEMPQQIQRHHHRGGPGLPPAGTGGASSETSGQTPPQAPSAPPATSGATQP
jgi:hypothetical protein